MLVLRQPMRVAIALIATMMLLGAIYGLLGVHFIAAFQVLIYVGAVMVFMVYAIMLLEVREATTRRYSKLLIPGVAGLRRPARRDRRQRLAAAAVPGRRARRDVVRHRRLLGLVPQRLLAAVRADVGAARRRRRRRARGDRHRQEVRSWIGHSS